MPLKIVRNNILEMEVDAIVNPTDYKLSGSGSIDKKIHDAGGLELRKECDEYEHCDFGDAVLTHAYNLPCKYIIHTVGKGDSLSKIAKKYGVTVEYLLKLNNLKADSPIHKGQQIKVKKK